MLMPMRMTKTLKFYEYYKNGHPAGVEEKDDFLSFFADAKKGKSRHLAV